MPLPGVLARIRTTDGVADPGTDGEIQLRGPQVFTGYWNDPAATEAAFTPDSWFRTGDIGAVDPATGHLVIRGRTKEMIITGGLNVYPREVEIALESHPSVAEAAVAGVADERWGERVTAWVVLADGHGFDEAALIAHARTLLAGYKCPKRVFRLAALPRNQLGKIIRSALRLVPIKPSARTSQCRVRLPLLDPAVAHATGQLHAKDDRRAGLGARADLDVGVAHPASVNHHPRPRPARPPGSGIRHACSGRYAACRA